MKRTFFGFLTRADGRHLVVKLRNSSNGRGFTLTDGEAKLAARGRVQKVKVHASVLSEVAIETQDLVTQVKSTFQCGEQMLTTITLVKTQERERDREEV